MEIQSTRFGRLNVDDDRVMTFPNGLLGFPSYTRFALIQTGQENYFFWLQSVDEPNLAFVVTDPSLFFKDYEVPIIFYTAHGNDNALKREVARMGNAQLLRKPAEEASLIAAISGVLRWRR